jgi:hypothetical protein
MTAARLHREVSLPVLPHITCRDRNPLAVKAALLGAVMEDVQDALIVTGDPVVFKCGPLIDPIRASCAYPGMFLPVSVNGRLMVDGLLAHSVPAEPLRETGADRVLAVYLSAHWVNTKGPRHIFDVIGQCFSIAESKMCHLWKAHADLVLEPDVNGFTYDGFDRAKELIKAGEDAAREVVPQIHAWFDCFLAQTPCSRTPTAVTLAPENFSGGTVPWRGTLPPVSPTFVSFPGVTTFAHTGKAIRSSTPLRKSIEIFGAPTVQTSIAASGGWSRLVAVLTARTPAGKEIVVSAGGVPTKPGAQRVTIQLINQATFVPKGSRLTLTLASSSTAQSSSNLLYLDLPMPQAARARVGTAILKLPGLRTQVTK